MSSPAALPPLSQLDHEQPASLDPVVWSGNLDALSREAPDFAKTLRETSLPDTWRPVLALDESRTYRTEPPGQPPTWLGHTAAPRTRARGMLQTFDAGGQNVALPCAGAGAELTTFPTISPRAAASCSRPRINRRPSNDCWPTTSA